MASPEDSDGVAVEDAAASSRTVPRSPNAERERQYPMLEGGITMGTVCEYEKDGWTWVVVTDLQDKPGREYENLDYDTDERLVRFLILDNLSDDQFKAFEDARGCYEHVSIARNYSDVDGAAGFFAPRSAFLEKFTALGPYHPNHVDELREDSQPTDDAHASSPMPPTDETTDDEQTRECEHCGETFPADDGVNGAGSLKSDGLEKLAGGDSADADEVFAFDEPYCSMSCALSAGGSDE